MARKAKLNIAVIGVGNMGKHHARVYSELPNVRLVAVVDSNVRIGKAIANKHKCNYYKNTKLLFQNERLNAVSIAVPTSLHKKLAVACIDQGIAVLIEKPIADSIKSAREIINSGKKVLGTVMLAPHPWADCIKGHKRVELITVTRSNHRSVLNALRCWLEDR